jgi:hypothetical protein
MEKAEYEALVAKLQNEAKGKIDILASEGQEKLDKFIKENTGKSISKEDFATFKTEVLDPLSQKASRLEDAMTKQGEIINGLKESIKVTDPMKTIEDILKENAPKLKELREKGSGFINIDLKAAAINSIANAVVAPGSSPTNPYAPGLSGPLTVYDFLRNPAFVSNYTNNGTTDQSRVAWINELAAIQGLPTLVTETNLKPLTEHQFQVEFSQAKKIASYIQLTEEFDQDLGYLSTQVQTMLKLDVMRAFDDQIQLDVLNNATQFTPAILATPPMSSFKASVFDATYFDALLAMRVYPRLNNFIPNVSLINPVSYAKMQMAKDTVGRYNTPSPEFVAMLNAQEGNKISADMALVGDLQQFNVLTYKGFTLKAGWINDDLIRNQFSIVGEIRFHDFISAARKTAIVYGDIKWIAETMNAASGIISGS